MTDNKSKREFRLKYGAGIRKHILSFSSTEKTIFGTFVLICLITAIILAAFVRDRFIVHVPTYGGDLHEGIIGLPRTINPIIAVTDVDRDISSLIYAGLTKYDGYKIVPNLAKSWKISDDGLTYTFDLNDNLFFQDGRPLTADDVVFTIQKIQDPATKSPKRSDWMSVIATSTSPSQVEFILKQPYSPFLTNTTIGIIPKHIWGSVSDDQFIFSQYNIEPVGAGPYKLNSVLHDSGGIPTEYKLGTWNKYFGTRPFISNISLHFYADDEKALSALDNGDIDSLSSIFPSAATKLQSNSAQAYRIISTPLPRVFSVFFNQSQAPILADPVVREALDMTVDREGLIDGVLGGYGKAIHGPLPDDIVASSTYMTLASSTEKAAALLEKNGWKKNTDGIYEKKGKGGGTSTISFDIYTADSPDLKLAAESIKSTWNKFGAVVGVKIFESSDLYQNVIRTRKYDTLLFGQFIGKDKDLYAFWHSSQRNYPGLNVALYANSKVDKLLEEIRTTHEDTESKKLYEQFYTIVQSDLPAIFLYVPDFIYAVPKKLYGVDLNTVTVPSDRWNDISKWYIETDGVWRIFAKKNQQ